MDEHLLLFVQNGYLESREIQINDTIECDLEKTEKVSKVAIIQYHSKTKYVIIYTSIILPLFIIFYIQNERIKRFSDWEPIGNYTSFLKSSKINKSSKRRSEQLKGKSVQKNSKNLENFGDAMIKKLVSLSSNNSFFSYISELFSSDIHQLQDHNISDLTSSQAFLYQSSFDNKGAPKYNPSSPCKLCGDFCDINCPNQEHLYSTDEASSSEIDFAGLSAHKAGKGKAKKNKKKVKRTRYAN